MSHTFNDSYSGENLNYTAFPMGGLGAGMICLDGTGTFSHMSLHHKPQIFHEPYMYAAISVKCGCDRIARLLAGPTPDWKIFFPWGTGFDSAGNGGHFNKIYGLPRFRHASFRSRFPFGEVCLEDKAVPLSTVISGWSPFLPGQADESSLPVAGVEYAFSNPTGQCIEFIFSFHSKNHFLQRESPGLHVRGVEKGFVFSQPGNSARPQDQADFCVECSHPDTKVNAAWFRGGWSDAQTAAWRSVEKGEVIEAQAHPQDASGSGASLYVPVALAPGQSVKIVIRMSWYVPFSDVYFGGQRSCCDGAKCDPNPEDFHQPWYAGHFSGIEEIRRYWRHQYDRLRLESEKFSQALHDTDMPPEMIEAVSANLSILKSPTMLRQKDGRIWAYEGCSDTTGCCEGSCTHVWNYAQAVAHLFPALERTMRETEFGPSQSDSGHQTFRAALPIGPQEGFWAGVDAAADGQLGGIMKVYRDWRISGDTEWLRRLWPKVRQSLDYCIRTWDPEHRGILVEPHHNTYDIEFWGPNGMCCSHYLGALKAAALMAPACGDSPLLYEELSSKGRTFVETELWNGEYFIQQVRTEGLQSPPPHQRRGVVWTEYSPEALELLKKEGPKYQYGDGCLAEGVVGAWLAAMCGLPDILDPDKVRQHLLSVIRHNFRETLWDHANPQRPGYALDRDGGLILCTWPRGGALTFPFPYSNEVWTGFEYHVAGHLMLLGESDPARKIVRTARQRHDGVRRNPFNEYECGSWYARALTSYGLLRAYSGARYDAIEKVLHMAPTQTGDFRCFLSTATGYGVVGVKNGKPYFDLRGGSVEIRKIELSA